MNSIHCEYRRWAGLACMTMLMLISGCGTTAEPEAGLPAPGPAGPAGPQGPAGPTGQAGPTGPTGSQGLPGSSFSPDILASTIVAILSATGSGGGPVTVGGPLSVTFTLKDDSGKTILFTDLDRFSIYVSGPVENYQRVIVPEGTIPSSKVVQNPDLSYTYTFAAFPGTYANPVDASSGGGGAVTAGTYSVGIEARRSFTVAGQTVRKAGDAVLDFSVGGAALTHRQIVTQTACETCHVDMSVHGGNRHLLTGCVLCHTAGALDLTPSPNGVSIEFQTMIHRLHRGAELPFVAATANGTDPYSYQITGFGNSLNNFSFVEFPFMPGGTGFNQQTRNCDTCHGGASQGELSHADASITQAHCSSCHDDIDFVTGTILDPNNASVIAGTLTQAQLSDPTFRVAPNGVPHQFPDGSCYICHGDGRVDAILSLHVPVLDRPADIIGLNVIVDSVAGASGGTTPSTFFQAGDIPIVTFHMVDANNNPVDMANVASVNLVLSGPVENYQKILPTTGSTAAIKSTSATGAVTMTGGVPPTGTGPFVYTSPAALPANYPAPLNYGGNFTYAAGWGELYSQNGAGTSPLVSGSYTIMVYAYRQFTVGSATYREASPPGLMPIRIGSAGVAASYPGYVTDAKCNVCHGDLRLHGNGRKGVNNCVMCHTAGAEDRPNVLPGQTQDPAPDTIDFKVMIHKIHDAEDLNVVKNGGKYDLVGFASGAPSGTGSVIDFSHAFTPVMPDGNENCTVCHATNAWRAPVERSDVNIWKVACTSCHDSTATALHAAVNTTAGSPGIETCTTCHGPGKAFAVDLVHTSP
jgi:OmcA/MtrC family decaheme c-type cytochrome